MKIMDIHPLSTTTISSQQQVITTIGGNDFPTLENRPTREISTQWHKN
jgi:hypothetical protein